MIPKEIRSTVHNTVPYPRIALRLCPDRFSSLPLARLKKLLSTVTRRFVHLP